MIDEVWESLREQSGGGSGVLRRRLLPDAAIDLFAAVEKPANKPLLFAQFMRSAMPSGLRPDDAKGFGLMVEPIHGGRLQVEVALADPSAESVFAAFVDDVLARVSSAESEGAAASALFGTVARWQRFFASHGSIGLSPEKQQGLFGELLFMTKFLAAAGGQARAVASWAGPTGSNQDFEWASSAWEVKSPAGLPVRSVRVSNVRQLDGSHLADLRLVVVELETHQNTPETLPEMVENVRSSVLATNPEALGRLNDLLMEAGYLDAHAPLYADRGYKLRAVRAFRVNDDDFPRLLESDLPEGVGDVRYSLSLPSIVQFEMEREQFECELGAILGAE